MRCIFAEPTIPAHQASSTKDLSGEENLVLSHIKSSHNEGSLLQKLRIHVAILKLKSYRHLDKTSKSEDKSAPDCYRSMLEDSYAETANKACSICPGLCILHSKGSFSIDVLVQYPTRKLYMLEGLEPSVALTGGPWYTDNELDTEFIDTLIKACFKFIRDSVRYLMLRIITITHLLLRVFQRGAHIAPAETRMQFIPYPTPLTIRMHNKYGTLCDKHGSQRLNSRLSTSKCF